MLKLVKWAYELGVRNERHRIANYLQSAQAKRFDRLRDFEEEMRFNPVETKADADKRKIAARERQAGVDNDIIAIIEGIFHGEDIYQRGASFMYPDKETQQ